MPEIAEKQNDSHHNKEQEKEQESEEADVGNDPTDAGIVTLKDNTQSQTDNE
jgi:hypothetical protein